MNIKKFIGNSVQETIRMVKKEMGPEAVILRTRSLVSSDHSKDNGGKKIEVTAAVDYDPKSEIASSPDEITLDALLKRWANMEIELKELKEAILSSKAGEILNPEVYFNEPLRERFMNYRSFGLSPEIIRQLMIHANEGGRKSEGPAPAMLRDALASVLARIPTVREKRPETGRRILSFIGPTGVGKTTTLAKLAALNAVKQGKKTALITLDTFRVAAVAQLESYARIMGIPLEVVVSRLDLQKAIGKHNGCDLILIDTAGRSPNHKEAITELRDILNIPEEIHGYLVLSATEQYRNLLHADQNFGALPFKSYIFTKLDETQDASSMINFLITRDKPVSYFTAGQQVPEDIEVASKKRLASLLLARMHETKENAMNEVKAYGSSDRT